MDINLRGINTKLSVNLPAFVKQTEMDNSN